MRLTEDEAIHREYGRLAEAVKLFLLGLTTKKDLRRAYEASARALGDE